MNSTTIEYQPRPITPGTKMYRVLHGLTQESHTLFSAAERLHDRSLHSTVSSIQSHGIRVERETVTVPGYQGQPTRCCRYWLTPPERAKALAALGLQ